MSRVLGFLVVVVVLLLSVGFAALNGGQRVTLDLGVVTLYQVPLTVAVFGSIVVGMTVMLVAGIHSDLRVRRILRERLAREDAEERARMFVDRDQHDLFDSSAGPEEVGAGPEVGAGSEGSTRPEVGAGDRSPTGSGAGEASDPAMEADAVEDEGDGAPRPPDATTGDAGPPAEPEHSREVNPPP